MKRILAMLVSSVSLAAHSAAPPKYVAVGNYATNQVYVSKGGDDSTAHIGRIDLPFLTISNAVQAAVAPAVVKVAPGVYNESVILRNGINIEAPSGVIVSQSVTGLPVFFDNGATVTNSITGNLFVIHTFVDGATTAGILLSGSDTDVLVDRMDIVSFGPAGIRSQGGFPVLRFKGKIICRNAGVLYGSGSLDFRGEAYGTNDYGLIASANNSSNYISGFFYSEFNSAVHLGGGLSMLENAVCFTIDDSFGWGVEHSGGTALLKNCLLRPSRQEAIGKYGGDLMIVDGCQLFGGTNSTYAIDNDGDTTHGSIEFRGVNWVNKAINPAMNIVSPLTNYAVVSSLVLRPGNGPNQSNAVVSGMIKYDGNSYTNLNAAGTLSNLASVLIPGNTLTNNGDSLRAEWGGVMPSAAANTNEFTIVYGSQTILDTGLQIASNTTFNAWCKIWRTGNTAQHAEAHFEWGPGGAVPFAFTNVNLEIVQTNGINTTLALQGAARRVGAHTNNSLSVFYQPAPR